jgi:hypothetical protein
VTDHEEEEEEEEPATDHEEEEEKEIAMVIKKRRRIVVSDDDSSSSDEEPLQKRLLRLRQQHTANAKPYGIYLYILKKEFVVEQCDDINDEELYFLDKSGTR